HLPLDVLAHLPAKVTFDLEVLVDVGAQPRHFLVGEVAHSRIARHRCRVAYLLRGVAADSVDVRERDLESLLARYVDAGDTGHRFASFLTLPLLVARVLADDPDRAMPADDLALVAHLLDRMPNLHNSLSSSLLGGIPAVYL